MIIPLMYTQPVLTIQMIEMKFIWFSKLCNKYYFAGED